MNIYDYKYYQYGIVFKDAPHIETKLSPDDIKNLFQAYKGWYIRNLYDFDCKEKTSFWFVICDTNLSFDKLTSKYRNQIRRAYNTLDIRIINKDELLEKGYKVYFSSYKRYKNVLYPAKEESIWKEIIMNNSGNYEYWGAFEKETGIMVAYSENLIQHNMVKCTALKGCPEFLNKYYPFYGLIYRMLGYYLDEKNYLYFSDGARSVTQHSNVQTFLEKFNFRKAYCKIEIYYKWWLKIVVILLYPFRNIITNKKIKYLLNFEAIRRGEL